MSDPVRRAKSPREEGELEDGEISDDSVRPDSPLPVRHRPSIVGYSHQHRPRPQRLHHGYRPKEQYRPPLRAQQQQQGDSNQRLSFWERSHDTLDRFRSRGWAGRARGGRFWHGGWRDRVAKPSGQRPSSSSARGDPFPRKPKSTVRSPNRKPGHVSRNENAGEESFEDLLLKYKQIKLELESIKKDETLALSLKEDHVKGQHNVIENTVELPVHVEKSTAGNSEAITPKDYKPPAKTYQAFGIKAFGQKLKPVTEQKKQKVVEEDTVETEITNDVTKPNQDSSAVELTVSCESNIPKEPKKPVEQEEELSELHLRLLALQSASKKWQQKEQVVMKESKEKLTKPKTEIQKDKSVPNSIAKKINSPGYAAKQEIRRQKTKAWKKLQQQKDEERRRVEEEERKKQAEEEERKKREEEIRKIRDLSNQEEQYNRFMKLVGGKARRSKSLDKDQRRPDKPCAESAGGIYQYDNYEEVAMDTDSETNSPDSSPGRLPYASDHVIGYVPSVLCLTEKIPSGILPHESKSTFQEGAIISGSSEISVPPPPLPAEEPEQPPKPPFADEEEEEEMMLREELIKSLETKRTYKPEEPTGNSQPSSPTFLNNIMPVPRITLTSTSINIASHHRKTTTQIVRVLRPIRRAIKLPKHKSVVVTLNASDDSESDGESIGTNQSVFGGLEFMIKEARRTAEASMPKAQSKSEKENDPMRTPDALPDEKKIEYRLLKEEIASREKQKLLKFEQSKGSLSPSDSDMEVEGSRKPVVNPKILEAEAKHKRHMMLLLKDESVLKHLLQQEVKKNESIKTAELKVTRLTEQMQVTEKFLNANRMFLKNLQEQITRVQLRVQEKKTLALKYSEELARTKALISQEIGKRKLEQKTSGVNKIFKNTLTNSPGRQSAEAIAKEKKRLQLLEQEYALKIQKLKGMQSQKLKEQPIHHHPVIEETPEFVIPQPSLLDLSQDKITLGAEENDAEDEDLTVCVKERRRSFRDNAFTKPNLRHTDHTPNKDSSNKPSIINSDSSELFLGLKIEELRSLYSDTNNLEELLLESSKLMLPQEKCASGKEIPVDVDIFPAKQTDTRPLPFEPYKSPLLVFKSYRFSPYFRTKEKLLLSSVSHSNMIEPKTFFCHFDLTGTCNDDDCPWQHMRDCTLSRKQLFQDILSYNLDLIGCSEKSTDEEIEVASEKYVDKVFGVNWDRMSMDQMSVLLVSYVNESNKHMPPHTTYKEKRKWRPVYWRKPISDSNSSDEEEKTIKADSSAHSSNFKTRVLPEDAVVTPDDVRYFTNETDNIINLEASVLENPQDIQLWIKLAYKCLHQSESSPSECLDSSLNVLSRALEHNRENSEIWRHYLKLFSKRGSREEVQEMCETAVEYASSYDIWWTYLNLENSFDGKDSVCSRTLQYLMDRVEEEKKSDLLSLQLLETLLYRVHLSLITGRLQNALALFQNALKCANKKSIADHLTLQDRCLAWLSYIHLMEFSSLPAKFHEPTNTNPSRIVNKEPFLIPWLNSQSVTTDPAMLLAVFEAAVSSCCDENLTAEDAIEIGLPLYKNMIKLYLLLNRPDEAVELCMQLLQSSMANCDILEALCSVYLKMAQPEKAMDVWISAFRNNIQNPKIFYYTCKFLVSHNHIDQIPSIMKDFVLSFFDTFDEEHSPTDLLRYLLSFSVPLNFKAPAIKESFNVSALQMPYMWLVFCLWQTISSSTAESVEAYEAALGAVMQQEVLQRLWMDYLVFTNRKIVGAKSKVQEAKHFSDLVNRCLMTVPIRHLIPFSTSDYWTNYEFHNSVIYFYLSCIPKAQHSKILEQLLTMMPSNLGLALRVLKQELEENNNQNVNMQSKMFTYNFPMCLPIWKIAIAVETFQKGHKEVHHLYQRALQKMPLCAALWKDQLLFEASGGGKTDNLRKLVSKCQEVGVSLDELLNINTESRSR
ncbi:zinc finger C3H1 domain-containing protein [Xenopus laevis]|uniref:Zinc finger C3H1 domain-containing protein n=2 Tax=Xenopus laevis TaxID=8355 RepID=A0A1L8GYP1_XENLA|nr:zinc finger C3H1 domain-containing protein [Xenopus laevis]OCT88926.1 hypothetical protein XELAEV_18017558mg [Xenopus laevis]